MDRAEAIEIIKRVDICANAAETARDMAIAALKEQERREQGCELCGDTDGYLYEDGPCRTVQGDYPFCPMCGRKLGGAEE